MKKKLLLTLTIFTLFLSGCSSISKEDYDAKVNELETTQQELKTVQKEYADYKAQNVDDEMKKSGAKAWVETAFGTDAQTIINGNDLYVNIPTGYTVSEKSIESLMNTIMSGLALYGSYYKSNPEQLPYDSITIIVLEENTKLDMLSMQFLKNTDGTFTQNTAMISISDFTTIIPYITKSLN